MTKKRKILRKLLFSLAALWIILLVFAMIYSRNFEYTIIQIVKKNLDKKLNTEIVIQKDNMHFSLLRMFPSASLRINDILVFSPRTEASFPDTLLFAKELDVKLNLHDLINHQLKVNQIELKNGIINLAITKNGAGNYKIWKANKTSTSKDSVNFQIESLVLTNTQINYLDASTNVQTNFLAKKAVASGSFKKEAFHISVKTKNDFQLLRVEKVDYLSNQSAELIVNLDQNNKHLYFKQGLISLEGLTMRFSGSVDQSDAKAFNYDISGNKINLQKISPDIKAQLLKDIPVSIHKGFASFKAEIGRKSLRQKPAINAEFNINDLKLTYTDKSLSLEKSHIKGSFTNGNYHNAQSTEVVIDTLSGYIDQKPVAFSGKVKNINAPALSTKLSGTLTDKTILKFIPDSFNINLTGNIVFNISSTGNIKNLKGDIINEFIYLQHTGNIKPESFTLQTENLSKLSLDGNILLNENQAKLQHVSLKSSQSDLTIDGTVDNWRSLVLEEGHPAYHLKIQGDNLNTSDFYSADNNEGTGFTLPDNLYVKTTLQLKHFSHSNYSMENVKGTFSYHPRLLQIHNLSFTGYSGSVNCSGSLSANGNKLHLNIDFIPTDVSVKEVFTSFANFNQENIKDENINGALSGKINCSLQFDEQGKIDIPTLKVYSDLHLTNGELIKYKPLEALSNFIDLEELQHIKFNTLNTHLIIENNNMQIDKTFIQSSAVNFYVDGNHNFSDEYTYHFQVSLSEILSKKAKKRRAGQSEFGFIVDDNSSHTNIPLVLTGKGDQIDVKYDRQQGRKNIKENLASEKEEWKNIRENNEEKDTPLEISFEEETITSQEITVEENENKQSANDEKVENKNEEEEDDEFIIHWEDE